MSNLIVSLVLVLIVGILLVESMDSITKSKMYKDFYNSKLGKLIFKNTSPFRHMTICAIAVGIGDVIAVVTDLGWLIGDMMLQTHTHHWPVLVGLIIATVVIVASFIWLVKSLVVYVNAHPKKVSEKRRTKNRISKQSEVIMKLNARLEILEAELDKRGNV